jgi:hypothetical protein
MWWDANYRKKKFGEFHLERFGRERERFVELGGTIEASKLR